MSCDIFLQLDMDTYKGKMKQMRFIYDMPIMWFYLSDNTLILLSCLINDAVILSGREIHKTLDHIYSRF